MESYNPGVYSPPTDCEVVYITDLPNNNFMNKLIGKDGKHFIEITQNFNCKYIWHDIEKNNIEIYGDDNNDINNAKMRIQKRLYHILRFDNDNKTKEQLEWMDNFRFNVICALK